MSNKSNILSFPKRLITPQSDKKSEVHEIDPVAYTLLDEEIPKFIAHAEAVCGISVRIKFGKVITKRSK